MEEQQDQTPTLKVQEPASDAIPPKPNTPKKESHSKLVAAVIVAAIVAVGLIGYFLTQGSENETESETTIQPTTDQQETTSVDLENTKTIWNDELIEQLREYDEANDNVSFEFSDDTITVTSNGLPDHETGEFPNDGNPNAISEQSYTFTIPRMPEYTGTSTAIKIFGTTVGGVVFDPGTAETDAGTGWSIEAFNTTLNFGLGIDMSNAHVQPSGAYHYHGIPEAVVQDDSESKHSGLVGFAADGFPVYARYGNSDPADSTSAIKILESSWQLKSGQRGAGEPDGEYSGDYTNDFEFKAGSGDLDECNGIFTITPEFPNGTYAYFLTEEFPFIPRCVMGTPDDSFNTAGGGAPSGTDSQQPPGMPPRP